MLRFVPPVPRRSFCVRLLSGIAVAFALVFTTIEAQIPGRNVNMVSGTTFPDGDPFLQRQNEPSIAASTRNPLHLLGGSNDYRTVDIPGLCTINPVTGECIEPETGDAWLGLFKSKDGGQRWASTLLPGYPQDQSPAGLASPLKTYQAGADPVVRAGTHGLIYYSGLVFDRGEGGKSAVFLSRFIDNNNQEAGDPFAYLGTSLVVASGGTPFMDKPWMAVDMPRGNADICIVTADGIIATDHGPKGKGNAKGRRKKPSPPAGQRIPAGAVYVSYTAFTGKGPTISSEIYLKRSTDCGATWSPAIRVSDPNDRINQGSSIAIDPKTGAVFVGYRRFDPDLTDNDDLDAMMVARLPVGAGRFDAPGRAHKFPPPARRVQRWLDRIFEHRGGDELDRPGAKPQVVADDVNQFDLGTTGFNFRTNAYPTMTADGTGRVYMAWTQRGFAADTTGTDGARIVITTTRDGRFFSPLRSVDDHDEPGRGHQLMPSMTFAGGKLMLIFYDVRETKALAAAGAVHDRTVSDANKVIRHTIDIRSAMAAPAETPDFAPSVPVSDYLMGYNPRSGQIEELQANPPNLPMFQKGTVPFMGDYIDVAAAPAFIPDARGRWSFNAEASGIPPVFHAAWTDNRDVRPPTTRDPITGKLDWTQYTPAKMSPDQPPRTSLFLPGEPVPECTVNNNNAGSRNQNIYSSRITGSGLIAGSPGNTKPLSTELQRGFVVFAQNTEGGDDPRSFRMRILNQPPGGRASFDQFPLPPYTSASPAPLTAIEMIVPPRSTASRTVYITSTDPDALVEVEVTELEDLTKLLPSEYATAEELPGGAEARVMLNPDIENPDIENGAIADVTWVVTNTGNTTAAFNVNLFLAQQRLPSSLATQLILLKTYRTPVTVPNGCQLAFQVRNVLIANIPNPVLVPPNGQPSNPNDPHAENATLWLEPGEKGRIVLRVFDNDVSDNVLVPKLDANGNPILDQNGNPKFASIDAAALPSEDVTPVVQQQSVNTGDAREGVTDPPLVTPTGSNLFFLQQPTTTVVNATMTPPVRVLVIDNAGAAVPGVAVMLSLNVPGVVISGNAAVTDETGVATFGALQINTPGTGYILTAIAGGPTLASAQSSAFSVLELVLDADLEVTQASTPPILNTNTTITLTVTNHGPVTATGVVLTDTLPAAATFITVTDDICSYNPDSHTVTCPVGPLAPGASRDYGIVIRPTAAPGLTNTASVTGTQPDQNAANNSSSAILFVSSYAACSSPTFRGPYLAALNTTSVGTMASADFNEDTFPDLFFAEGDGNFVLVLSDGVGGFQEPQYFAENNPRFAITADFNEDGHADVAVVNQNDPAFEQPAELGFGFGDGTGNFAADQEDIFLPLAGTFDIATGDFNHDNHADVVVSSANSADTTVVVLLGVGDGSFGAPISVPAGTQPGNIVLGDYDLDGHLDIAVNNINAPTVSILRGNGEGGFSAPQVIGLAVNSQRLRQMNDVNGDGAPDLAVTTNPGGGALANLLLLMNDGAGNFPTATEIIGPRGVGHTTTADLNGDGRLDVAAIVFPENRVVVLEGNGAGQFTETASYLTGTSQNHFLILDANVDGRPDIVGTVRGGYYILLNSCAGDQGASADLDSTVIGPETGAVGDQLTYTAFVANNGPDPATNVVATFIVPSGMSFVSSSNDCTVLYGTVQCSLPTIAAEGNESFTVTVQAFAAGTRVNRLFATATEPDPDSSNNVGGADTVIAPGSFTFVVTSTADAGPGTLRQAIADSNLNVGSTNQIHFNVTGEAPFVIAPQSGLPTITVPVIIDGYTQPGSSPNTLAVGTNAVILIELRGNAASGTPAGFNVIGGGTTIKGLAIGGFRGNGILLDRVGGNLVQGNFLGTNAQGAVANPNNGGVLARSPNNLIGGATFAARNLISGNTNNGVRLTVSSSGTTVNSTGAGTVIVNNLIGTTRDGLQALANTAAGVSVSVPNVTIGGLSALERNVISGNAEHGVGTGASLSNNTVISVPSNLVVQGNYVGVTADGSAALPNIGHGVILNGATSVVGGVAGTTVGACTGACNVISGNTTNGVGLYAHYDNPQETTATMGTVYSAADGSSVIGNFIGLNAAGTARIPNGPVNLPPPAAQVFSAGINVGARNVLIGGTAPGAGNVVSGNNHVAINLFSQVVTLTGAVVSSAEGAVIAGNYIGLGPDGMTAIGNANNGINLSVRNVTIGGSNDNERNLISGNGAVGISAFASTYDPDGPGPAGFVPTIPPLIPTGLVVTNNYIGTNATGMAAIPNLGTGLNLSAPAATVRNNLISGNTGGGLTFSAHFNFTTGQVYSSAANAVAEGNLIGVDVTGNAPLPNTSAGVFVSAPNVRIGGATPAQRNVIGANRGGGISIGSSTTASNEIATSGIGTVVQGNYVGVAADGNSLMTNLFSAIHSSAAMVTIGGPEAGQGNLVAGATNNIGINLNRQFAQSGVVIHAGGNSIVQGNTVGLNAARTARLAPGTGIFVQSAGNQILQNVIAGNGISPASVPGIILNPNGNNNVVKGNIIGTNLSGDAGLGNAGPGVFILGASGNTIGGSQPGDRNVIAGNGQHGVILNSQDGQNTTNNRVIGNYIGVKADGATALPNTSYGVWLFANVNSNITGNTIGGSSPGEGNLISGNGLSGVALQGSGTTSNTILGNLIGTIEGGLGALPNATHGIFITDASDNTIGGTGPTDGNLIAFNPQNGIITDAASVRNRILGNRIHSNTLLGIDLNGNGVSANDQGDGDAGGNNLQNFPVLSNASNSHGATTRVDVNLTSFANGLYTLQFFANAGCDPSGNGEGQRLIGHFSGHAAPATSQLFLDEAVAAGQFITATATDADGNSSEFSACATVDPVNPVVINTNDGGPGSLRQAILDANSDSSLTTITFNISGPLTIAPLSSLPTITAPVVIDGTSQPGWSGSPIIELSGANVGGVAQGLRMTGGGSTVRGLVINRWTGSGISLEGAGNNVIESNWIGTNLAGTAAAGNAGGIQVASPLNRIGGTTAAARNVISGNTGNGVNVVAIVSGNTVVSSGAQSTVIGNYIGVNAAGTALLVNSGAGVSSSSANVTIGGPTQEEGNIIAGGQGGDGISLFRITGAGGVVIDPGGSSTIQNNTLGLNANRDARLNTRSLYAINVQSAGNQIIQNVIAGNGEVGTFGASGIRISGAAATGNSVRGNLIGTTPNGAAALGNTGWGVLIADASSNTIGGILPSDRNVIAGNELTGILISVNGSNAANNNVIQGNYIGISPDGLSPRQNFGSGIGLSAFAAGTISGTIIGGEAPGARNVIARNFSGGIIVSGVGVVNTIITGNYIGVAADGVTARGNTLYGIRILDSDDTTIGGTTPAAGNRIANNSGVGVLIGNGAISNRILFNTITANELLGIDLVADGNNNQQPAVLTAASNTPGPNTTVTADLPPTATGFTLQFFANVTCDATGGEGDRIVGHFTGVSGRSQFTLTETVPNGQFISATITDSLGNTSEFAVCTPVGGDTPLLVSNTNDSGVGSLRQAIIDANTTAGIQTIQFNIPGAGPGSPAVINLVSALPAIADPVVIDGASQPGYTADPIVEINGSAVPPGPNASGLIVALSASESTIRGLSITGFPSQGIYLNGSNLTTVEDCWLGVRANGTTLGNGSMGIYVPNGSGNVLRRNVIGGNGFAGIYFFGAANGNQVENSRIGTDATGTVAYSNLRGVGFEGSSSARPTNNTVSGNLISGNLDSGIRWDCGNLCGAVGTQILNNTIGLSAADAPLPNGVGLQILTGAGTIVTGNTISGNTGAGITINEFGAVALEITPIVIKGNRIGVTAAMLIAPNAMGIRVFGAVTTIPVTIGGTFGEQNTIRSNLGAGIWTQGTNVSVLGNDIDSNGELGIDAGVAGVTANDPGDGDGIQNFPVLTVATNTPGPTTQVGVTVADFSPGLYTLHFYASPACDASGHGEGQSLISIVNGVSHGASVMQPLGALVPAGHFITATATDSQGNTSEFSLCRVVVESGIADHLAFVVQPSSSTAGAAIAPPIQVAIQDAAGNTVTTATDAVTLGIGANPGGGGLFGTVTGNAVNGIATFSTLSIDRAGNGYSLVANSGSLTAATSQPFDIQPSVFTVTTTADSGPGTLRQAILDANGRTAVTSIIGFNFSGPAPHTITPQSPLPGIAASMIIDGTAAGACTGVAPTVVLNGDSAGFAAHGLLVNSPGVAIRGLAIGGFAESGIFLAGGGNNLVECNYLGVAPNGTSAMPNEDGVRISGSSSNIIGGATASARNMIAGNSQYGVNVANGIANRIEGNFIGTDAAGNAALGNGRGIFVASNSNQIIANVVSGNAVSGVEIVGGATDTTVAGNLVGTDAAGATAIPNHDGISIGNAPGNTIGGTTEGSRNVVSGNTNVGIGISGANASGNTVVGNYIGTSADGLSALGNAYGVDINSAANNVVGGTTSAARNIISGNTSIGLELEGAGSSGNVVEGNFIGVNASGNALGNGGPGIQIIDASSNTIGGSTSVSGNTIAFNGSSGVRLQQAVGTPVNNRILSNSIHANAFWGIDLGLIPTNDAGDADTGPNNLQNYPLVASASATSVSGSLSSAPNQSFTVQLFENAVCDPSLYGEGQALIDSFTVTTDGDGNVGFSRSDFALTTGRLITATATDDSGNTSAFGACTQVNPSVALTPNPFAIVTNTSAPMTVTLSHPAGVGGQSVTLVSNDPVAAIEPSIVIAEGASTGTAMVTTGSAAGSAIITATAAGFQDGTANVNVSLRTMTLSSPSSLVGVGRSLTGTMTLGQPAPTGGLAVNLVSGSPSFVTVSPPSVTIAQGGTTGTFTINGIASGSSTITASATGASNATLTITATTSSLISMGNPPVVAPGQTSGVAVSLGIDAPAGGVTISFVSSDTNVLTITPSVFVPAGLRIPAANPQITGVVPGTASITASAPGFAPDTRNATVTLTLSFTPATSFAVIAGRTSNITLNLSSPAPAGGLTLNTSIDNTSLATVPATVFVAAGLTSVAVPVTGVAVGNTTVRASGTGIAQASAPVTVNPTPSISIGDTTIGKDLEASVSGTLGLAAPAGGVVVTITSLDPSRVLLATADNVAGSTSITRTVTAGSTFVGTFWVQALAGAGTADIQATAPGYANDTSTITMQPSGFILNMTDFTTNTGAANTTLRIDAARLAPATLAYQQTQAVRGGLTVNVTVTSSNTAVGTIAGSPLAFGGGDSVLFSAAFDPATVGSSAIGLTTPGGFGTPSSFQSIVATVEQPTITVGDLTIGKDLESSSSGSIGAPAPAGNLIVTITSLDTSKLLLANDSTSAGSASITVQVNAGNSFIPSFWVHALAGSGSAQFQTSAPGYATDTSSVTLQPSGFILNMSDFTTNTFAANTTLRVDAARLNPTTLNYAQSQSVRGGLTVNVPVTSSDTNVGTIVGSPAVFAGGNAVNFGTAFDPVTASPGVTISLTTPAGFSTPNSFQSITATVTAPNMSIGSVTVGRDLQAGTSISLGATPPSPVTVTVTSNNGTIATVTKDGNIAGGTSLTFTNVTTTFVGTIFIQGLGLGTTTVTVQAPGYSDGTSNVTVDPSGFILNMSDFTTNTFAANTTLRVDAARLNPATLNYAQSQAVRGGLTVNVPVTSSDTNVGTMVGSPAVFAGGDAANFGTAFNPAAQGTATISLTTPSGFSTPSSFRSVVATVNAPTITVGNVTVGRDLQVMLNVSLQDAPPSPVTVTITANDGGIATITTNGAVAGGTTVTFTNVTTTTVGTIFVQGRGLGATTLTTTAAGYTTNTSNVTVDPSGFILNMSNFTTNAGAANTTLRVDAARLNPATLNYAQSQPLRGGLTVNVPVSSSNTAVGTIVGSPAVFNPGDTVNFGTAFDPAAQGPTTISVATPAGFSMPSNLQSITATVNP